MIQTARGLIEALKTNPLALALVVINVLFLGVMLYLIHTVQQQTERKDELMRELAHDCLVAAPKGDRQ